MTKGTIRYSQIGYLTGLKRHALNARAKRMFDDKELDRSPGNQVLLNPMQVRKLIGDSISHIPGKIIYIGNLKGGVGKTTLAFLLANSISTLGLKTCVVDLDVQANLTQQYVEIDSTIPVFVDVVDNKLSVKQVILELSPTLHLLPSSLKNSLIQKSLALQTPKHYLMWLNGLCLDYLRSTYDVIIVDTPPNLTTLNAVFCLCLEARDHIVIPACAEDFSMMGVDMFIEDILNIRTSYKVQSDPKMSIIMNRFFQNQKISLEMLRKMDKKYDKQLSNIIIRDSAKIREVIVNKTAIGDIKHGKEIYSIMASLLDELDIIKKVEA